MDPCSGDNKKRGRKGDFSSRGGKFERWLEEFGCNEVLQGVKKGRVPSRNETCTIFLDHRGIFAPSSPSLPLFAGSLLAGGAFSRQRLIKRELAMGGKMVENERENFSRRRYTKVAVEERLARPGNNGSIVLDILACPQSPAFLSL